MEGIAWYPVDSLILQQGGQERILSPCPRRIEKRQRFPRVFEIDAKVCTGNELTSAKQRHIHRLVSGQHLCRGIGDAAGLHQRFDARPVDDIVADRLDKAAEGLLVQRLIKADVRNRGNIATVVTVRIIRISNFVQVGKENLLPAPEAYIMVFGYCHRVFVIVQKKEIVHMVFKCREQHRVSLPRISGAKHAAQFRLREFAVLPQLLQASQCVLFAHKCNVFKYINDLLGEIGIVGRLGIAVFYIVCDEKVELYLHALGQVLL